MRRRDFLQRGLSLSVVLGMPLRGRAAAADSNPFDPVPGTWRTFEVTTVVTLPAASGPRQAWVPIAAFSELEWMRPGAATWQTNATSTSVQEDPESSVKMVCARWDASSPPVATLTVTDLVSTRNRHVDFAAPGSPVALTAQERAFYTAPTKLLPTDGIVKTTATKITNGASTDLLKAKLLYEWIVANTYRNPKTRGCGLGNVKFMLDSGDLGGKCADINALYVALARSVELPARDIYGIRVAPSQFGYKSLGANNATITKAQHCRAEVYLTAYGWVPVDPADVRKVILEEPPGHLAAGDPKVVDARQTLFGAWEGNWMAYNQGHDVSLPGWTGDDLGFLMYPQAQVGGQLEDSLSPGDFTYTIAAREVLS
jgi:transglutaminase-like putative cysteine protease